jgi:hypothetical protein
MGNPEDPRSCLSQREHAGKLPPSPAMSPPSNGRRGNIGRVAGHDKHGTVGRMRSEYLRSMSTPECRLGLTTDHCQCTNAEIL